MIDEGGSAMASAMCIAVDPLADGRWRVWTVDDSVGGVFASRKAAMTFANGEARWGAPRAIILNVPRETASRDTGS